MNAQNQNSKAEEGARFWFGASFWFLVSGFGFGALQSVIRVGDLSDWA
jgi:hypothetical protein